jgi:hypothetical protein
LISVSDLLTSEFLTIRLLSLHWPQKHLSFKIQFIDQPALWKRDGYSKCSQSSKQNVKLGPNRPCILVKPTTEETSYEELPKQWSNVSLIDQEQKMLTARLTRKRKVAFNLIVLFSRSMNAYIWHLPTPLLAADQLAVSGATDLERRNCRPKWTAAADRGCSVQLRSDCSARGRKRDMDENGVKNNWDQLDLYPSPQTPAPPNGSHSLHAESSHNYIV